MNKPSQRGVALVTTLIMLSVVTLMAIVFLAVTRRERASVTVAGDQISAQLMADAGQARAQAEVLARIRVQTNLFNYDLMVSTNFINPLGFQSLNSSLLNVNYAYANGSTLNAADQRQNIANLKFDPRPPVYITTNSRGATDFRFYLDFNRNGRYEKNGWLLEFDRQTGRTGTNHFVGDPEWIGVLERPDFPHSASNRFIGRYAYLVLPAGKTLDLNFIHNQAKRIGIASDGFLRNQGVGSWEINLAAFLRELNTNAWPNNSYAYRTDVAVASGGLAFDDAKTLLTNRYRGDYSRWLASVDTAFGANGKSAFRNNPVDGYSDGALMTGTRLPPGQPDDTSKPWTGSDNPNGYFDIQELFTFKNRSPYFANFTTNRLDRVGLNYNNFYDRYTFYRALAQLGVDSTPALTAEIKDQFTPRTLLTTKVNLNYSNDASGLATNFLPWKPIDFFTNSADRILKSTFGIDAALTNIQIWPTNFYSPALHRSLQLAANIYDSTGNRTLTSYPYLPSVFRPQFKNNGTNVVISGYVEETGSLFLSGEWLDLNNPSDRARIKPNSNVYGIPLVIGATKGYPNFNEFAMQTTLQLTRKMEVRKSSPNAVPNKTNQMYILSVSNLFGLEAWNSYSQPFPRDLEMRATNLISMALVSSNGATRTVLLASTIPVSYTTNIPAGTWPGKQFLLPIYTNRVVLSNSAYFFSRTPHFVEVKTNLGYENLPGFPVPQWQLLITNRIQYVLIDRATRRIVDFVNLANLGASIDMTEEMVGNKNQGFDSFGGQFWDINGLPPVGLRSQLSASLRLLAVPDWDSYSPQSPVGEDKEKAIDRFRVFMGLDPQRYRREEVSGTNTVMQVPFTPTRKLVHYAAWQVNDPLVHYLEADITNPQRTNDVRILVPPQRVYTNSNLGRINERYQPWGGNPNKTAASDPNAYNLMVKDPLVRSSDDWDFPTNKLANVGWLGRVHRGTPWQTVYLKSEMLSPLTEWVKWSGDTSTPFWTHPTNDWRLLNLFTVAPNANAASGLLSVNQTNLAAWSAVLSGVLVLTNTVPNSAMLPSASSQFTNLLVEPNTPQLKQIVNGIIRTRAFEPGGSFNEMGRILATPELTVRSPYLNTSGQQMNYGLNDLAYERIPQQILSLIKNDEPRVVIYAFGQALRPAPNSVVVTPGAFFQLCTNYQVVGEVVTKSVLRITGSPINPALRIMGPPLNPNPIIESFNRLPND